MLSTTTTSCSAVSKKYLAPWRVTTWDATTIGAWTQDLDGADILINLTGRSVNCCFNSRNRREILESRVTSSNLLGKVLAQVSQPPPRWLNASTATIYRQALDRPMDEATGELGGSEPNAPDTWKFSIDVAKQWESAFFAADPPNTRRVALRSAMVKSPDRGGIFDVLLRLVRFGLEAPPGPDTNISPGFMSETSSAPLNTSSRAPTCRAA
jgi:NAD dependent epimerase/dehydratase family enzyme